MTTGDVAGSAPELIPPLLEQVPDGVELCFFGPPTVKNTLELSSSTSNPNFQWINCGSVAEEQVLSGSPNSESGSAAYQALQEAVDWADGDRVQGLLTLPLSKSVIHEAGYEGFRGHTDFFEEAWDCRAVMTFLADDLAVSLLTRHRPLSEVPDWLTEQRVVNQVETAHRFYQTYVDSEPSFALLGLNPHAGEEGLLGPEEEQILTPAIEQLNRQGVQIEGPFPADSFFPIHGDRFDLVFACYHDQGLIPFKQDHFFTGVHASLGLPVLRVSPDHGIAANLAGQNQLDPRSAINSLHYLCRWLQQEGA